MLPLQLLGEWLIIHTVWLDWVPSLCCLATGTAWEDWIHLLVASSMASISTYHKRPDDISSYCGILLIERLAFFSGILIRFLEKGFEVCIVIVIVLFWLFRSGNWHCCMCCLSCVLITLSNYSVITHNGSSLMWPILPNHLSCNKLFISWVRVQHIQSHSFTQT